MTLRDYIDQIRFELNDEKMSWEYARVQVNHARREIAKRTRCQHCTSILTTTIGGNKYRIPYASSDSDFVDVIEVLDVLYDGEPLDWINNQEMVYKESLASSGTPIYWSYFGGEAQPSGYVQVEPKPDAAKTLKIHAIQFPLPLINNTDTCELNDVIQQMVVNKVVGEILLKRGHPEGSQILRLVERGIYDNIWLKSL